MYIIKLESFMNKESFLDILHSTYIKNEFLSLLLTIKYVFFNKKDPK